MARTKTIAVAARPEPQQYRPIDWERERVNYVRDFCNLAETWRICSEPRCKRHQTCLAALPCSAILALPPLTREQQSQAMADLLHFKQDIFGDRDLEDEMPLASEQTSELKQQKSRTPRPAVAKRADLRDYHHTVRAVLARLWWPPRSAAERERDREASRAKSP